MNILCPHCQKLLSVPEEQAGQSVRCSACNSVLSVPVLPKPEAPMFSSGNQSASAAAQDPDIFKLALDADQPDPKPGSKPQIAPTPEKPADRAPIPPPPPPPPAGPLRVFAYTLNPQVVVWMTPIALLVLFFLLWFTWTGIYPGGKAAYTQSAIQMTYKSFSTDAAIDKVMELESKLNKTISWSGMTFLYVMLVLAGLVFAALPLVLKYTNLRLPPKVQPIMPYRLALVYACTGLAFVLLLLVSWMGFSLETAVTTMMTEEVEKQKAATPAANLEQLVKLNEGMMAAFFQPQRTVWYRLAFLCNLVALVGAALDWWLAQRAGKPLPRVELHV